MIHDIDLALDLVRAPVKHVEAFGISIMGNHEDTAQARIKFEHGCIADLTASRVSPAPQRTMQVWSHGGCVTADFNSRDVVSYAPSETLLFGTSPLERIRHPGADISQLKREVFQTYIKMDRLPVPSTDALMAELNSFVDCVIACRQPVVPGSQAVAAMRVASLILAGLASHQWDGFAQGAVGPFLRQSRQHRLAG